MNYFSHRILQKIKSLLLVAVGLLCFSVNYAQIAQFGGPDRNGVYPATGLLDQWPAEGPELVGTITGIGDGYASPTVTDNGVYIAGMLDSTGYVFHFGHDQQLRWKTAVGPEFNYKYVGARGAPTIEGNRLYYAASMGDAVCLDATTGEVIWRIDFKEAYNAPKVKWGYTESPLIYGEKIFFTPGGKGHNFIALDKMNGTLLWASSVDSTLNSYCSPVMINHQNEDLVLLNSRDYILIINPENGDARVKHPLTDSHYNHALAPIYRDGVLFYSSGYGEGSTLFKIVDGKQEMDTLYSNMDLDAKISGMILYDGTVFGTSDKRKLWTGIDFKSGETVFTSRDLKPGSFILADNKFYMYSDAGEVALATPSKSGFSIVSRFQIPAGRASLAFAHPVMHDGILYIRYQDHLWLYKVK